MGRAIVPASEILSIITTTCVIGLYLTDIICIDFLMLNICILIRYSNPVQYSAGDTLSFHDMLLITQLPLLLMVTACASR